MNMFIRTTHPDMSDQTTFDENMFVVSSGYYNLKTKNLSCTRPNGRSDYFLYYVLKGKSRYVMNGEECFAEAGDVVFYNIYDSQSYSHLCQYHSQIYWAHFNGLVAAPFLQELKLTKSMKIHTEANISIYFENILNELTFKKKLYFGAAANNLASILIAISRELEKKTEGEAKFDYVISLMHSLENNKMTLMEYANLCGLSKSQFIRSFTDYTGTTPMRYKNNIIIKDAQWYLLNTDLAINEIAAMLKFDNVYYFSNMFKKHTGLSPRQFREKATL